MVHAFVEAYAATSLLLCSTWGEDLQVDSRALLHTHLQPHKLVTDLCKIRLAGQGQAAPCRMKHEVESQDA